MRTVPGHPSQLDLRSRAAQTAYELLYQFQCGIAPRRYNLTVSHARRFAWFRVAKVGSRTVIRHLRATGIELDVESAGFVRYVPALYRDYYKFAFVRNPWDRLVSCWKSKVVESNLFGFNDRTRQRMQDFAEFVGFVEALDLESADRHLRLQSCLIDLNNLDFVGRLENFDHDFAVVLDHLAIPGRRVRSRNRSADRTHYEDFYSDVLVARVAALYRRDVSLFGYAFGA